MGLQHTSKTILKNMVDHLPKSKNMVDHLRSLDRRRIPIHQSRKTNAGTMQPQHRHRNTTVQLCPATPSTADYATPTSKTTLPLCNTITTVCNMKHHCLINQKHLQNLPFNNTNASATQPHHRLRHRSTTVRRRSFNPTSA